MLEYKYLVKGQLLAQVWGEEARKFIIHSPREDIYPILEARIHPLKGAVRGKVKVGRDMILPVSVSKKTYSLLPSVMLEE